MMPLMKKILVLCVIVFFLASACKVPNSAAYIDEYFASLLPQGTKAITKQFLYVNFLKNENISATFHKALARTKPNVAFLSPMLNSELPTIQQNLPNLIPIIITNSSKTDTILTKKGYAVSFDQTQALIKSAQYLSKRIKQPREPSIIAIITDTNSMSNLQEQIIEILNSSAANEYVIEFFLADDLELAKTLEILQQKNISHSIIAVSNSRLFLLLNAFITNPEILVIVQGEPPPVKIPTTTNLIYVYWDIESTLQSLKIRKKVDTWISVNGLWKIGL